MEINNWKVSNSLLQCLSPYEKSFYNIEFGRSLEYYRKRIIAIGFTGMKKVVDVGCGMGQWSIALSLYNENVVAVDVSTARLLLGYHIASNMNLTNIRFQWAEMSSLPFEDEEFDAVFSYGALMFGNIPKTLKEFNRILKKNGLLYANVNGYGWYAHLLIDRIIRNKDWKLFINVSKMFLRLLLGMKSKIPVGRKRMIKWLKDANFEIISIGGDANYIKIGENDIIPIYKEKYYGLDGVIEFVAKKQQVQK